MKIRGEKRIKNLPRQVSAGPSQTMVLTEEAEIWWWGNNSRIKKQCTPVKMNEQFFMDVEGKNNAEEYEKFCPVNIDINWSKTLSVATLLVADLRYMDNVSLNKRL